MNRITVILLAALDAVIALGVGVAIPLVPLTVAWGLQFDLSNDWLPFWHAGADIWLLGHGVDVTVTLNPVASAAFGLTGTNVFTVSIAALGFALLTVFLGTRTGRRAWATPHPWTAAIAGIGTFAVLSALVTLSAHTLPAVPSLLQGSLLPAGVFAIGIGIGMIAGRLSEGPGTGTTDASRGDSTASVRAESAGRLPWPVDRWNPTTRAVLAAALRGGVAASALVVAVSAVLLAVLMAVNYGRIVGLYETLQPGVLGAIALTLAQLALLPNAVIWTASWIAGPGFAVGTGSSVDVAQTALGPLPSVPLFGALPQGDPGFGLIAIIVPVLCGVAAGFLTRQRLDRMPTPRGSGPSDSGWSAGRLSLVVLGTAVVSGAVLGLLAWWASGAIGPGRLQQAGPNPLFVAGAVAAEVLVGAAIGVAVRREHVASTARLSVRERRISADPSPVAKPRPSRTAPAWDASRAVTGPIDVSTVFASFGDETDASDDDDWISKVLEEDAPPPVKRQGKAEQTARAPARASSGLARPSAPRVPTPRGRLPRVYRESEFASPDFSRHETADPDEG
ncbi:cell division protein PerM [Humibacter sp.]|uniref:cell division protein PerM n=1 Tax=Humibacter sp. TaxID=1940291 RepID=UPI003F7CF53D